MRRLVRLVLDRHLDPKYSHISENVNLRSEYSSLLRDVPEDIEFASLALDKAADAINLWIGNHRSTTSLHKDHYENIYVQIRGRKHFVLLPPIEMPCVNEQSLTWARYTPIDISTTRTSPELTINVSKHDECLPVATWDPDQPEIRVTPYSHLSRPHRVTLDEGDMLYLPAMCVNQV